MGELGGVEQPPEERLGLARAAQLQEGVEREGGVAHPAEAVVPVAFAADLLGQRGGRGGGDRSGGGVEEQLERQGAADHGFAPRPVVGALRGPASPIGGGPFETRLDVLSAAERPAAPGGLRTARSPPSWTRGPRSARRSPPPSSCASPASQEQTASASEPATATGIPPRRSSRGAPRRSRRRA